MTKRIRERLRIKPKPLIENDYQHYYIPILHFPASIYWEEFGWATEEEYRDGFRKNRHYYE